MSGLHWGEVRNACKILVKTVKGRDCLGCKHRLEDSIKLDLTEAVHDGMDWIQLAQDKIHFWTVVNKVLNFKFT